jgi:hypothetical protein
LHRSPLDPFELIEKPNRGGAVFHLNLSLFLEGFGIEESQVRAPIAHDEIFSIIGQPPPLRCVSKLTYPQESLPVVDESNPCRPGELDEAVLPCRQSFRKIAVGKGLIPEYFSRLEFHLSETGPPDQPCRLEEKAVGKNQTLCECFGIMGIDIDDLIAIAREGNQRGAIFLKNDRSRRLLPLTSAKSKRNTRKRPDRASP